MFGLNPYAKVWTDGDIRRFLKRHKIKISAQAARTFLHAYFRVCDVCGPGDARNYDAHVSDQMRRGDVDDDDYVQRRSKTAGQQVWVHRECAPMWGDFEGMNIDQLEDVRRALIEQAKH
jgi:hypothetical protein